jgi:hypothetical protein
VALNVLFEMMKVDKWVPHREAFLKLLADAQFEVTEDFHMPPVEMPSDGLILRYGVTPENMVAIEADLRRTCADRPWCRFTPTGFFFDFPYRVFVCQAV